MPSNHEAFRLVAGPRREGGPGPLPFRPVVAIRARARNSTVRAPARVSGGSTPTGRVPSSGRVGSPEGEFGILRNPVCRVSGGRVAEDTVTLCHSKVGAAGFEPTASCFL